MPQNSQKIVTWLGGVLRTLESWKRIKTVPEQNIDRVVLKGLGLRWEIVKFSDWLKMIRCFRQGYE